MGPIFLLASQLTSPVPLHLERWYSGYDYPSSYATNSVSVFQPAIQALVDDTGRIVGCRTETASSDPRVDALACAMILKRASFAPARWMDGTPVPGVYRAVIAFQIFGDDREEIRDVDVDVARLPAGLKSPADVSVAFAVEPSRKIVACGAAPKAFASQKDPNADLLAVACKLITEQWTPAIVTGKDGKPSRSVQNATVRFSLSKKP